MSRFVRRRSAVWSLWHCTSMVVALAVGMVPRLAAQLIGYPLPSIVWEPVDATIAVGETAGVFGVGASDFPYGSVLTYQWRKEGRAIPGATSAVLTIVNAQSSDAGSYDVVVTGRYGSVRSRVAHLTVTLPVPPLITEQPADLVAIQGNSRGFTVNVSGHPRPTYQWRKNGTIIAGATAASLYFDSLVLADAGSYDVVVSNSQGTITSRAASLVVNLPPITITQQPASLILDPGESGVLVVGVSAASTVYCRWRKDGVYIPDATTTTFTLRNARLEDAGDYDAVLTLLGGMSAGWVATNIANVAVVLRPTVIASQPTSVSVLPGETASFFVGAGGVELSYQWRKNGRDVAGANRAQLVVGNVSEADVGYYSVLVRGTHGTVESHAASLFVAPSRYTRLAGALRQDGYADGAAGAARFSAPWGIAVDRAGNVYVAENRNATVRKVAANGDVSTIAGKAGEHGYVDGVGGAARFAFPTGLALDAAGILYVGDNGNGVIRRVAPDGTVSTVGDGRAPIIRGVGGVALDAAGDLYVSDYANHTVVKFSRSGSVTPLAGQIGASGNRDGQGADARFSNPFALAVDSKGNVFVSDDGNGLIRTVAPDGTVRTVPHVGSSPCLAIDHDDNLFVAVVVDAELRRISPDGTVTTLSRPSTAYGADTSGVFYPRGLAVDFAGNLYLADTGKATVLKRAAIEAPAMPTRFTNLSTRGRLRAGEALTLGFGVRGSGTKTLLIRAVGPTLSRFGVAGVATDPRLDLMVSGGAAPVLLANDNWATAADVPGLIVATSRVGAFALDPDSLDAAGLLTLATATATSCSVRISTGATTAAGTVLGEIYDADVLAGGVRLANLATLGFCGTGDEALIAGFSVSGRQLKRVLIRAVGPSLAPFGVQDFAPQPQITIYPGGLSALLAMNDRWGDSAAIADAGIFAGAFPLATGSRDAALITDLLPGSYTVIATSATRYGAVLIEVYDLDP